MSQQLLQIPTHKQCMVCGRRYARPIKKGQTLVNTKQWLAQKTCSIECRIKRMTSKDKQRLGRSLRYNKRHYECAICHELIVGNISNLKQHKYERHAN